MAYIKNIWVDQDVERPKTYEVTNNQDGSITLTDSFGLVTELGTPVNAVNMNHIEDGLADTDLTKYNATTTYNAGEWVTGVVDNEKGIYASKVNNNTGNALSNDTYWEKVELGGGASRNIGEIVASTIPLTDAGLHLLDGSLILGGGIYSAFVDYIASIYDATANYFCTESEWQTAVTTYGVCGKFVYDSVNNTVRLPKYSNKIYTQELDTSAPVLGNGIGITLTDGTSNGSIGQFTTTNIATYLSSNRLNVGSAVGTGTDNYSGVLPNNKVLGLTTDPTKSGIIAQLSNITTSLDGYYYIVIATSTKTDIQVDIDAIATDLNGKADVDLTNCTKPHIVETYVNGTSWYRVYSDGWCEQGGVYTSGNTLTFIKPFKDTNYSIQAKPVEWHAGGIALCAIKTDKTYATLYYGWSNNNSRFNGWWNSTDWQACGYIR